MRVDGQLKRAAVETLGSDPSTTADKFTGRLWYNTASDALKMADEANVVRTILDSVSSLGLSLSWTNKSFEDATTAFYDESDNTKIFKFQASGITTGNTRVYTVPDFDGTLATLAGTETLTNKTISGGNNTLLAIPLGTAVTGILAINLGGTNSNAALSNNRLMISSGSAIVEATAITASRALASDANGIPVHATTTTTELNYVSGVTSAIQTQINGKLSLSIGTTKGDILVFTGSATAVRQAIGSDGQVLTADSAQTNGLKWASPVSAPSSSMEASNYSIACSVGSSALTIALKDAGGSDCSAGSAAKFGFRSATSATGTYTQVSVTGALSTVISSGSTAGHANGIAKYIYVYVINNAGTAELAWSSKLFDDGSIVTTTAEGGAGAADSSSVMYSTTARTGVACRVIGRLLSNQATAGTWAAVPTEISLLPFRVRGGSMVRLYAGNGHGSTKTKIRRFSTVATDTGTDITYADSSTNGASLTINTDGFYTITYTEEGNAGTPGFGISKNESSGGTSNIEAITQSEILAISNCNTGNDRKCVSWAGLLVAGDVIRPHTNNGGGGTFFNNVQSFTIAGPF